MTPEQIDEVFAQALTGNYDDDLPSGWPMPTETCAKKHCAV
jgi:hypothetical protein